MLGAVGGAVAAYYVMDYMVSAGLKLQGCILTAVAAAAVVTIALVWVFKMIAVDGFGFAKLNALKNMVTFRSKEYQELFDQKNPKPYQPSAGMSRA